MISINNLFFRYQDSPVFSSLCLEVHQGESLSIIGRSGSGKTTLFRLLTGLLQPHEGEITLNGQPTQLAHPALAYMMQDDLLLPWRTLRENILLPFELGKERRKWPGYEEEATHLLQKVGLYSYRDYYPDALSGGMRQRGALVRTLLQKKPIVLLDEPFGALDVTTREEMYALLREEKKKHGTTLLFITHDFHDAQQLGDRVILLSKGEFIKEWSIDAYDKNRDDEMRVALRQ